MPGAILTDLNQTQFNISKLTAPHSGMRVLLASGPARRRKKELKLTGTFSVVIQGMTESSWI